MAYFTLPEGSTEVSFDGVVLTPDADGRYEVANENIERVLREIPGATRVAGPPPTAETVESVAPPTAEAAEPEPMPTAEEKGIAKERPKDAVITSGDTFTQKTTEPADVGQKRQEQADKTEKSPAAIGEAAKSEPAKSGSDVPPAPQKS